MVRFLWCVFCGFWFGFGFLFGFCSSYRELYTTALLNIVNELFMPIFVTAEAILFNQIVNYGSLKSDLKTCGNTILMKWRVF